MIKRIEKYLDKMFNAPEQHCDGCGESVVSYLLTHIPLWDGDYCKRCLIYEEPEEGYKAWCGMCNSETTHIGVHCGECGL